MWEPTASPSEVFHDRVLLTIWKYRTRYIKALEAKGYVFIQKAAINLWVGSQFLNDNVSLLHKVEHTLMVEFCYVCTTMHYINRVLEYRINHMHCSLDNLDSNHYMIRLT